MSGLRQALGLGPLVVLMTMMSIASSGSAGELEVCILRGVGGEPYHEERFRDWSRRLVEVWTTDQRSVAGRVQAHPAPDVSDEAGALTREDAAAVFRELAGRLQANDTLLVILIGHGSVQQEPKFMVAGPDIAAGEFKEWLDEIPTTQQVVINAASSSAAFINVLSASNRVICTSTRSGTERNATEFMGYFVAALEGEQGDADRDGTVTVKEACDAAAAATQQWYAGEGYILTEHALLDDNGDGRGRRLPLVAEDDGQAAADGDIAGTVVLKQSPVYAKSDPALVARYRAAVASVKAWTDGKETVEEAAYWARLEELLLAAARLNREIHQSVSAVDEVEPGAPVEAGP